MGLDVASFRIDITGIEGLSRTLGLTAEQMREAVRRGLAGDGGEALAIEMRSRTPRGPGGHHYYHQGFRSWGHTRDDIRVHDEGAKGVYVGYQGALSFGNKGGGRLQKGAWLESGTKPHTIRAKRFRRLYIAGHYVKSVEHPGSRPQRIAQKSLRATKWEVESGIIDEINKMAERVGWTGGYVGL